MEFLKKHKQALMVVLSIVIVVYAIFLFILPNVINLNNYKKDIQKIVSDSAKLKFDAQDIRIITTPSLKVGVKIKGLDLSYPDERKIATISDAEVKISLLPLIFKTVRVSDITVENPELNLVYTKDSKIDLLQYINKNLEKQQASPDTAAAELPVNISTRLPVVVIKNYKLTLKDEKTSDVLSLNGDSFVLDKAVLNKHFRVFSNGKILLNDSENILYDVRVSSFWPAMPAGQTQVETDVIPQIDFIKELVKYSPKAVIKADLKIEEHSGHVDLFGDANADNISIVLNGKRLPDSFLHMQSNGHKTTVASNLYVSNEEKAILNANIGHGRKTKIALDVKTDKISFSSLQEFATAFLNSLNIENDIAMFNSKGYINADFSLKTDLKNFESSGFLKVLNGSISHKSIPVEIVNIGADVDFSKNNVNIKKAGAVVNGSAIEAKGTIDSKANADIVLTSEKINIAPLFNAFAPLELKKAYILKDGILGLNVFIKGQLAEIEPNINVSLNNLSLKDKLNTFVVSNNSTLVNIKTKGSSFAGDISLNGSSLKMNNPHVSLNAPEVKVKITPEDITIVPFSVKMNSSKINVSGSIKNYIKNMKIDVLAKGSITSNDIKNLLPKDIRSFVGAKGVIPLNITVKGNDKKIEVNAQAFSNVVNYFSPVTIKKMIGESGLVNLSLVYSEDNLSLTDASLYQSNKSSFSNDYVYNKKGALKIAGLSGNINHISSSHPDLRLDFSIPQSMNVSIPFMPSASLKAKGDMSIYGTTTAPLFKGFMAIRDINLPDMLTKVQEVDLEFNGETITAKLQNLDVNGTQLNIDADASTKFSSVFLIKTMRVTSANFDADNLFRAMDKMAKTIPTSTTSSSSGVSKGTVFPVKISNGTLDIQKFKMKQVGGDLVATGITGTFNLLNDLFTLNNLKASVYNGLVGGNVTYNLANTVVKAKIYGKGVSANPVVTVFSGLKDQMMGNIDFGADVRLRGATYEQQMQSLNGKVHFVLKDGQMGSLGRFETFLKADNLISEGFVVTKIGSLVNTIAPYNTGKFSYLNGDLNIVNGLADLSPVKMSGPHMSLLITGDVNILSMISDIQVMGSLSPELVSALGPIADLSVEKFALYIPKFGAVVANALNIYNAPANKSDLAKIPTLTPAKEGTKSFKVRLRGNLNKPPSTVKSFQWLNTPEKIQEEQKSLLESLKPTLPTNKEELKQQVKEDIQNQLENNEKIQELKQNKAVQTFGSIYKFYKDKEESK